ncbi:MAG: MBL fold metallo-hydrolase [Treponema sp.]|nr:MBL fold metallo-hydrolase [Treponema sp.]
MNKNIIQLVVGPIATNCWIYPMDNGDAAIIDPGGEAEVIISALEKHSLSPKYILLSHGHFDHIFAVPELVDFYKDKIQIAIHRLDGGYLGADAYKTHCLSVKSAMGSTDIIDAYWKDLPPADILLEEGSTIGSLTVLHLPGHTPGGAAFWDKKEGVLFTGDTLFRRGYGRTDFPGGNEQQLFESLKRLFEMDPKIKVYPGHGETTSIGNER